MDESGIHPAIAAAHALAIWKLPHPCKDALE
jgi:hypothetical protein